MKTKYLLFMVIMLLVTACSPATPSSPADRFAGTWSGTMSFTDDPAHTADVIITIPTGCSDGAICGDIYNKSGCQWAMTLVAVKGDVFEYEFSKTLLGGDPCAAGVGTNGTLTLKSDGILFREHKTPAFTATGSLTRQ